MKLETNAVVPWRNTGHLKNMNKNNAAQYLPLLQALIEGKTLQLFLDPEWVDRHEVDFSALPERYRIKPEPGDFYISFYKDGRVYDCQPVGQPIEKLALGTVIRVREILDDETP
jgi:hypothetical protein